jgi:CheY-like chemotaxis protein
MKKLLIIDDDESVRKVLRFRLKDSYEITDTGSPEEALALALQIKPDAILLDLMMPKYSGFEVCRTLSFLSFTRHIPIVVVSGEATSRYQDFCEGLGAKAYFQKPVDIDALKRKLAKLMDEAQKDGHAEPHVLLRVVLKLRWTGPAGQPVELLTASESVSANGFICGFQELIHEDAVVEVFLAKDAQHFVGKARIARLDWPGTPGQRAEFQFVEKPSEWVLR